LDAPDQVVIGWAGKARGRRRLAASKDEQHRQRTRGRPDRVRSAFTQKVKVIGAWKGSIHTNFLKVKSGRLRFLGLRLN
jgi:hypothetical protein